MLLFIRRLLLLPQILSHRTASDIRAKDQQADGELIAAYHFLSPSAVEVSQTDSVSFATRACILDGRSILCAPLYGNTPP